MFDVSSRAKLSVSALAERKIASARPRKYGLLLRAEEEMLLYGQALASAACLEGPPGSALPHLRVQWAPGIPRALSFSEGHDRHHLGARAACERWAVSGCLTINPGNPRPVRKVRGVRKAHPSFLPSPRSVTNHGK